MTATGWTTRNAAIAGITMHYLHTDRGYAVVQVEVISHDRVDFAWEVYTDVASETPAHDGFADSLEDAKAAAEYHIA